MNRTIKFRGKSIYDEEWLYGSLVRIEKDRYAIIPPLNDIEIGKSIGMYEVYPETIGQFTGLHDKNGKEIYEGDIVEQIVTNGYGYGFIGEVGFDNGVFGIKHKTYKGYIVSSFVYSSDWNDGHAHGTVLYEYELKGNIYDNPELIKEEL